MKEKPARLYLQSVIRHGWDEPGGEGLPGGEAKVKACDLKVQEIFIMGVGVMRKRSLLVVACMVAAGASSASLLAQNAGDADYRAAVEQYCTECHNLDDYSGGLDIEGILDRPLIEHAPEWERAIRRMRAGVMPPPGQDRPPRDQYMAITEWLENQIDQSSPVNPGSKMLHRLNRTEYTNAVRDLLGLDIDVSTLLPADTSARGFDNIAGSLTISPTLLEAYATAAARVSRIAVGFWRSPTEVSYIAPGDASQNYQLEGMPMGTRGGMAVKHNFLADGLYTFHIQNFGVGAFFPGEELEISIDGERIQLFKYEGVGLNTGMGGDRDGALEVTVPVKAGTRLVGATFVATNYRPPLGIIREYDRKSIENEKMPQVQYPPVIGLLKILGPFEPTRPLDSVSVQKVFTCRPVNEDEFESCAREIITPLATKAYRRPVAGEDLDVLMAFFRDGAAQGVFEDGIELALRRMLADPEFLVRVEREPADVPVGEAYKIADLELASRLSFFLWSSIPDEELLNLAVEGRLSDPAVQRQQVMRMLNDPKSQSLVTNFGQQYLYLRNLPSTSPDAIFFPNWDDELRLSFLRESELFWESIIREDRSILDMIDANYTFLNERLAKHYDIPNIYGSHFRRVELGPEFDHRRGILGKGSFLSTTFTENFRTSPVKRGVWVIENILGTVPPEPPPNVPALEETQGDGEVAIRTLRDQLTLHRADPVCATCHRIMDPIGFALESFNADGSWRTHEGHPRKGDGLAVPLDTTVELWDGTKVDGVAGLREALKEYSPQFARFMTEKLLTYALGRGVEYFDMPVVRRIVNDSAESNYKFSDILLNIVFSEPFQMRVKEGEGQSLVAGTGVSN
jgi:mono/diheme cytochrome c family protein